ncbi:MAG: chain A iron centre cytochrome C protein [Nitrospirae bacterium GWC2_57_13]|nr:MAG: chain A iron centre cytochrome C protein [Nitrospirae bacterium GWC2_57_13]HAR45967.1 chain A iron centre cytochrome C protein [Nitrospiraceae bacterium]HAS53474.1 chain A iron centre cytochrome C protein [Nitrospiraceae bacterium]
MDKDTLVQQELSRRNFLFDTGKIIAGAAGIAAFAAGSEGLVSLALAKGASTGKWPWPYVKLDPQKTADIAYEEWYRVFCGAAVINSVFSQLREKVGEPYKSFPSDAFVFLEGGMVGWGTVCGSNAGANVVSNVIIGPRIAGPKSEHGHSIGSDMMQWYSDTSLPVFTPKEPRQKTAIIQTTSESPLCHVSVGKWMKKSGYALASPERKDRCARVAASVAYKLVQDLNDWKDGKYDAKSHWAPGRDVGITAQQNCTECHGDKVPSPPMAAK